MKAGSDIGKTTEEIFNNISYLGETPTLRYDAPVNNKWYHPYEDALNKITIGFFGTRRELIEGSLDSSRQVDIFFPLDGFASLYFASNQNVFYTGFFAVDLCTRAISAVTGRYEGVGIIGLLREIPEYVSRIKGKKQIQSKPSEN